MSIIFIRAFNVPHKARVRLDAADDQDVVGSEGMLVEMNRKAFRRLADDDRFHAGPNRAAHRRFGHAVAFNQLALPFRRPAAVAPHRRHNERLGPEPFEMLYRRLNNHRNIRHPAAAAGDGDGFALFDPPAKLQAGEFFFDGGGDVVDLLGIEGLADAEEEGVLGPGRSLAEVVLYVCYLGGLEIDTGL